MRKVLLRIVFDQYWRMESVGNELLLGYGWVLAAWAVIALASLGLLWRVTRDSKQVLSSLVFWGAVPTVIAMIPVFSQPLAQSGVPLFGYGFMLFVGFSTATFLASRRAKTVGLDADVIWDLMMWLLIPGIVGARIVYLLQYGDRVFAGKQGLDILKAAFALWDGGIVFYGCIIGGVVGMLAYCRKNNIRPLQLGDILMPSLFLGLGFGRIGCFLYGCCFGAACSLPWAVHFPADSMTFERLADRSGATGDKLLEADGVPVAIKDVYEQDFGKWLRDQDLLPQAAEADPDKDGRNNFREFLYGTNPRAWDDPALLPPPPRQIESGATLATMALHPAQIYSSVLAFSLAGLLMWFFRRRPFEGAVLALGWILYPINRFVLEIIRDDEPGRMGTGLTFSQLMSIGLFVSGCGLMIWLQRKNSGTPEPVNGKLAPKMK